MKSIRYLSLTVGPAVCLSVLLFTGCATTKTAVAPEATTTQEPQPSPIVLGSAPAKITMVNEEYRFVVVDFSARVLPAIGSTLNVMRGDQQVGTIRITEPVRGSFATADIVEGDLRAGDFVR